MTAKTNQQGTPEALRLADALQAVEEGWSVADKCCAELRRLHAENERLAALVKAQQPAPSAAAAGKWSLGEIDGNWRDIDLPDHGGVMRIVWRMEDDEGRNEKLEAQAHAVIAALNTPQPSPTPQADSQPAPQGETNAQLDTDSNSPTPGQQRDVAGPVAVGQPVGHGSDSTAGDPSAQRNKLLTVAERNIRSFLRSAVFKSESDREAALNCVDVLWEAARAPADSVLEDAARLDFLCSTDKVRMIECEQKCLWRVYQDEAPPEAVQHHWQAIASEWHTTPRAAIDAAIAARKQGAKP